MNDDTETSSPNVWDDFWASTRGTEVDDDSLEDEEDADDVDFDSFEDPDE